MRADNADHVSDAHLAGGGEDGGGGADADGAVVSLNKGRTGLRGRVDVAVRDDAVVARLEGLVDRGQQVV